jgi:hypothetical protein
MNVALINPTKTDCQDEGEFSWLAFNPEVDRIRHEAASISARASSLRTIGNTQRTVLSNSAANLRVAADALDALALKAKQFESIVQLYGNSDLTDDEFARVLRHLGLRDGEIEKLIRRLNEDV